jgi:hypothetical protein
MPLLLELLLLNLLPRIEGKQGKTLYTALIKDLKIKRVQRRSIHG